MLSWTKQLVARGVSLGNAALWSVTGRKIDRVDQRMYWEARSRRQAFDYERIDRDPYYASLDATVVSRLRAYSSADQRFILEVGAYEGYRLRKYGRTMPERRFVGIDIGFDSLQLGRERLAPSPNAVVLNADATALPFRDRSMALVYSVVALSHVSHALIGRALAEMIRVTARAVVLVEIDSRPMQWRRKMQVAGLNHAYMHRYEALIDRRVVRLAERTPLADGDGHPRYTLFVFERVHA